MNATVLQNCRLSCTCADTKDEALELNRKVWRAPPAVGPEVLFTSANSPSRCCHSFHLQEIGNCSLSVWVEVSKKHPETKCWRTAGRSKLETLVMSLHNTLLTIDNPTRTFFRFFLSYIQVQYNLIEWSKLSFTDFLFAPGDIHKFHDLGTVHGSKIYRPIEGFGWSGTTWSR